MKKATMTCFLLGALVSSTLSAQEASRADDAGPEAALQIDSGDKDSAVRHFVPGPRSRLDKIKGRHLDNVRGYSVDDSGGTEIPGGATPDAQANMLRRLACNSAVFGVVQMVDAVSFAGKDDFGVFTKYRFKVLEDWHGRHKRDSRYVTLIMNAGEIDYMGEKIRVENPRAAYSPGGQYILVAGDFRDADKTIVGHPPFVEVTNGTIYPATGKGAFPSGTSVKKARTEVQAALAQRGCQ